MDTTHRSCTRLTNSIIFGVALSGAAFTMASKGKAIWKSAAYHFFEHDPYFVKDGRHTVGCSPPANHPVLVLLRWDSI